MNLEQVIRVWVFVGKFSVSKTQIADIIDNKDAPYKNRTENG